MTRTLHVIIGPTAAGKSALAMQLAEARSLSIVSADSRQVYQRFDIGTAKPSLNERERVKHYGIDVVAAEQRYSAAAWAASAEDWIRDSLSKSQGSVIVGGTGFYIRALVNPLSSIPLLDAERRDKLAVWLESQDTERLRAICARLDPNRAALGRTQLIRAVETVLLTGTRVSDSFVEKAVTRPVRYLVVDPGDAVILANQIERRVQQMIANGWVQEVQQLVESVASDAPAWLASGYKAIREHVTGSISLAEAERRVVIETRQYAKRQRTWCRHQLLHGEVTHVNPLNPLAAQQTLAWWDAGERRGTHR